MKPNKVVQVMGVLGMVFIFGSTLAYANFPEHTNYVDVIMVIYIVLLTVFGMVMLKRSDAA